MFPYLNELIFVRGFSSVMLVIPSVYIYRENSDVCYTSYLITMK